MRVQDTLRTARGAGRVEPECNAFPRRRRAREIRIAAAYEFPKIDGPRGFRGVGLSTDHDAPAR